MIHCKSCRKEKEASAYSYDKVRKRLYKTCNVCRAKKKKRRKITIEMCRQVARSRGGECLSETYKNPHVKLQWRCSKGHEWSSGFHSVDRGDWCAACAGLKRLTIEECQALAKSKEGKCLSKTYKNEESPMRWQCKEGHEWTTRFGSIKNGGHWCPACSGRQRSTIESCQEIAQSKGGECLSETYKNAHTKLQWKCSKGHEWKMRPNNVKSGQWCPACGRMETTGKSEEMCREIFERCLQVKFPTVRPKWLDRLELDGYNKELNIAFEYNGKQHYNYIPFFHGNDIKNFEAQRERDQRKYKICKERGIRLVLIPYTFTYENPEELETYIQDALWTIV